MPTFFTDEPAGGDKSRRVPLIAPNSGPGFDYRPRRREGGNRRDMNEGFAPAEIPAEVKEQISARTVERLRSSKGPNETMFLLREYYGNITRLASLVFGRTRSHEDNDDDADEDEGFNDADGADTTDAGDGPDDDGGPKGDRRNRQGGRKPRPQQQQQQSRDGDAGGGDKKPRRRSRRGGRGKPSSEGAGNAQSSKPKAAPQSNTDGTAQGNSQPQGQGGGRNRRRRGRRGRSGKAPE